LPSGCAGPPFGAAALAAERPAGAPSPDDPLEEVIVNGLRWWLDPTRAVAPVTVLDRRDIERGGHNSIGDVLQALPMTTGSPLNTNANAPGERNARWRCGAMGPSASWCDFSTVVLLNGGVYRAAVSRRRLDRSQHAAASFIERRGVAGGAPAA
jgi:hypothetical protein